MSWHARLDLEYAYAAEAGRTHARFRHDGPLRVLRSLYPEPGGVCHSVLVHPPGGLVGGDTLRVEVDVAARAHALLTTPGAARFYRSDGENAVQDTRIRVAGGARLEWLPLEMLCYDGCLAENRLRFELDDEAWLLGWDVLALGLPHAGQPFERGSVLQHLEFPGVWLERGRIDAQDRRLLDGRLGLAGHRCLASLVLASGSPMPAPLRERALAQAREAIAGDPLHGQAGATSPNERMVVVRALSAVVEPALALLKRVRAAWRAGVWDMPAAPPRIWAT